MSHSDLTAKSLRRPLDQQRLAARLEGTRWLAAEVFDSIGSTNEEAAKNAIPGRVLVASHQTSGRGRLARPWVAPPHASVAISVVLPLPVDSAQWGWAPLLVGIVVRRALAPRAPQVGMKWPNDLLARAEDDDEWRKLVGILCQTSVGPDGPVLVVGVGINTDVRLEERPVDTATSLRMLGQPVDDPEDLVADVLDGLAEVEQWLHAAPAALEQHKMAYRRECLTIGLAVRVETPEGNLEGIAHAIDDAGRLVVRHAAGDTALAVGDVVHVRPGAGSGSGWR
ncbi:biotin--[acetyl-CoA-carboxylase] ligase [Demetria terragena]|uniref:biotin--[acetyl-CoA-carboxylase] ligase n=1 Tax=Demetria terragena TaxID=63959 RepID=UPI000363BF93|nr:biotin--[acetyl-CoA-carboxylase] ligase [Demetria terragena]